MAEAMTLSSLLSTTLTILLVLTATNARNVLRVSKMQKDDATSTGSNFKHVCDPERYHNLGLNMSDFAFCDKSLSYDARARHLVSQMTLAEKVQQLGDKASGVSRLGLPLYEWWSEALHGVSNVGPGTFFDDIVPGATSFPTPILTAAAFNESLWRKIGEVVSTEARAMYNLGRGGLTYWSPNVNVVRDPRWGRAIETPGEDPFTVGRYAANYVRGLQDVEGTQNYTDLNSRPLKVSSCCKHYAAYDVDNWKGIQRYTFDARVTEQDMTETFLRPFEMCIKDGDVSSVMCSYNRVNGIPACADPKLLNQTIRTDWDLHGYIVSDCDSIEVMVDDHKWLGDSWEEAVSQALKAGLDLDCGTSYPRHVEGAVEQGLVREADIDKSLKFLYIVLMRLGFFDGNPQYESLGKDDVCSSENLELAIDAARQGIVLLKNDNETLPLNPDKFKSLAVVGPHANATRAMIGNYAGVPCQYTSPIDGISSYANVNYSAGCADVKCKDDTLIFPAVQAAKSADATIVVVGIDLSIEAESLDREDLLLPGYQTQLINQVATDAKGPVILVIMSAGGLDISFAKSNNNIKAILWAGYPGEEGGRAIADVIFGKYNPGGKLPLTWHEDGYTDMLPMTSMPLRPIDELGYPGRTYKFFNGSTVYPFGHGLSYTKFNYSLTSSMRAVPKQLSKFQNCHNLKYEEDSFKPQCPAVHINDHMDCSDKFGFEVEVHNAGSRDGSEVVMVYAKPPKGIAKTYIKQLIGFRRVSVPAGSTEKVKFEFNTCESLRLIDDKAYGLLASGGYTIEIANGTIKARQRSSISTRISAHGQDGIYLTKPRYRKDKTSRDKEFSKSCSHKLVELGHSKEAKPESKII